MKTLWENIAVTFCFMFLFFLMFQLGKSAANSSNKKVSLVLLAPDGSYVQKADVSIDHGTLWKREDGNTHAALWEVEPDRGQEMVHIHVVEGEDFLIGDYDGPLTGETNEIKLHLHRDASAGITGNVFDDNMKPISGVEITIVSFDQETTSNAQGWFNLDIHASKGELVNVLAMKVGYQTYNAEQVAGAPVEIIMRRR